MLIFIEYKRSVVAGRRSQCLAGFCLHPESWWVSECRFLLWESFVQERTGHQEVNQSPQAACRVPRTPPAPHPHALSRPVVVRDRRTGQSTTELRLRDREARQQRWNGAGEGHRVSSFLQRRWATWGYAYHQLVHFPVRWCVLWLCAARVCVCVCCARLRGQRKWWPDAGFNCVSPWTRPR